MQVSCLAVPCMSCCWSVLWTRSVPRREFLPWILTGQRWFRGGDRGGRVGDDGYGRGYGGRGCHKSETVCAWFSELLLTFLPQSKVQSLIKIHVITQELELHGSLSSSLLNLCFSKEKRPRINRKHDLNNPKVATTFDIEYSGDKKVFCCCWKSN